MSINMLGSYVFNNAKLLMVSNIGEIYNPKTGKGTLGKNYSYQITPSVNGFFKDPFNSYLGAGALCNWIDDFNGDNFDHSKLDFIHGASFRLSQNGARPIASNPTEPITHLHGEPNLKKLLFIIILDLLILELRVHLFLIWVIIYPLIQLIKMLMDYHLSA